MSEYIKYDNDPELNEAIDQSEFASEEEIYNAKYHYQFLTIDEIQQNITNIKKDMDSEYQKQRNDYYNENKDYPHFKQRVVIGVKNNQFIYDSVLNIELKKMDEDHIKAKNCIHATILKDFNEVNNELKNKYGLDVWGWEAKKLQLRYQAKANNDWNEALSNQLSETANDEVKESEKNQNKVDELAERFSKLKSLKDKDLNLRRLLAFNTMLEQGYFDDAENICKIFENLSEEAENEFCDNKNLNQTLMKTNIQEGE